MTPIATPTPQDADRRPLVLIVDDTPVNIQVLAEALSRDYRVKVATNGGDALAIAASPEPPDLILLDVMMPGMDGYEVCRRLRASPVTGGIPIIFVTALGETADEERGLDLGAVDYISKPFQLPVVRARVRTHLNLKRNTDLLASLAMLDGLTQIANRRRFDQTLATEWRRAERDGTPLALLMADLDYFKQYNDHYGHGAGDQCLQAVAGVLTHTFSRPGDLAARYGGEEFAAILPETDLQGALLLAERFRLAVAALAIPHARSAAADRVSVSVGVAVLDRPAGPSPTPLLCCADTMLYQAKQAGRNRVEGQRCPAAEAPP